jgi:hypothetical protein
MPDTKQPKRGDLRVWHIPQVPCKAFRVDVHDVRAAADMIHTLQRYDEYQLQHRIKPMYSSVSGLEVYDPSFGLDPWVEWHSVDGHDILEHMRAGDDVEALVWEADAA